MGDSAIRIRYSSLACRALTAGLLVGGTLMIGGLADGRILADEPPPAPVAPGRRPTMEDLQRRIEKVETELEHLRLQKDAAQQSKPAGQAMAVVESPYLGTTYNYRGPANGSRFVALRLLIVNPAPQPITIRAKDIVLNADGTDYKIRDLANGLLQQTFQVGGRVVDLSHIPLTTDLVVPANGSGAKWIAFGGIPVGPQIPAMILHVAAHEKTLEANVNEAAAALAGLKVERIGPRGSLALVTVSGELNTVNVGNLVGVLESMVTQKVVRAVIRFSETAPPVEGQVLSWLQQGAYFAGRGENNIAQTPAFPSALRELHLAAIPNHSANLEGSTGSDPRIHKTDVEAVRAALKTAFEVLPRDELLEEIKHGNPLTRLAALEEGGGRLASEDLPLVLSYADDNDPRVQKAALVALRHFGERPAIDKLLEYARKNSEPTVSTAIESLAASRYAVAHQALLDVLRNEHPASRRLIMRVLAKYPRPIWSETIYSFVNDPQPPVAIEALRALVQTGHPRLFDVLKDALARGSAPLRNEAFQLLAARTDRQSEELAVEYTLEAMQKSAPTPPMYALLIRTKDPRAVPLLLAQLDRSGSGRSQLIGTLSQIGDQTVADGLAARYPKFSQRDKTATLNALQTLKSPQFRKLAADALAHNDSSLVSAAVSGLQNDGGPQAVSLLVHALDAATSSTVISYLTQALGNLGTPDAKAALNRARDSGDANKQTLARAALHSLQLRSPGYVYLLQGRQFAASEHWDEAIARFTSAIELDSELGEAYSGRGHTYLQKQKLDLAHKDFSKAVQLDPYSSEAVTGLAICLVQLGQVDKGIKMVEDSRPRMKDDFLFAYNAGCVYGRAFERALKEPKSAEREKKAGSFRDKAIADLRKSVQLGFPDLDWMKKDPDLESLHDAPEFKNILSQGASPEEDQSKDNSGTGTNPTGTDTNKSPAGRTAARRPLRGGRGGADDARRRRTNPRRQAAHGSGGLSNLDDATKADLQFENARP